MRNGLGDDTPTTTSPTVPKPFVERVGVPLMWMGIGIGIGYIACLVVTKPKRQLTGG